MYELVECFVKCVLVLLDFFYRIIPKKNTQIESIFSFLSRFDLVYSVRIRVNRELYPIMGSKQLLLGQRCSLLNLVHNWANFPSLKAQHVLKREKKNWLTGVMT